jgi:hypothetical protein
LPLAYDRPASIGKVRINRLSHWYRFNKTEGHYLGVETQLLNSATTQLYARGGYSFGQKAGYFHVTGRFKGLESQMENQLVNLSRFDYNQTSSTISALFSHRDDIHYYHSMAYAVSQTIDLSHNFNAKAGLHFEEQRPVDITTRFSLAGRDRSYAPNYRIQRYNNHKMGIELNYLENKDIVNNRPILYRGKSFFNVSFKYDYQNKSVLKATENRSIYHLKFRRFQSIANPLAVDFKCIWHKQDQTDFLQEMNFTNRFGTVLERENDLEFYSLNHYDYYFGDYFKLQGDVDLFNFPKIFTLRMVLGSVVSCLKPAVADDLHQDPFNLLSHPFWEYGIVIKGISICNFYIVKNNLHENKLHYFLRLSF